MKVRLTRNTLIAGEDKAIGDTVEVDKRLGRYLVSIGKATTHDEVEAEKAEASLIQTNVPGGRKRKK